MDKRAMITIVDDDESVREATANLMRAAGYAPQAFSCARAFLDSSNIADTDILIADVQMPGMSGFELHDALVDAGKHIPTLLITAYPDERMRTRALHSGVVGYLTKPFNETELLDTIQSVLRTAQTRSIEQ
jgi:FixJ family two-component response regulator